MKITDKDRLDFIERNRFEVDDASNIKRELWRIVSWEKICGEGNSLRQAIDNAIMAMRERDK